MSGINLDSWRSHPLSYANTALRLFEHDGTLFRGIGANYEAQVRELFQKGVVDAIVNRGLFVETEITEHSSADYPLVIKHERIRTITYPLEWAPEALRAAGKRVLDLQETLLDYGHLAADVNPWNIIFRRSQPVFVDFGSLLWGWETGSEQFLNEFDRYYLWPLLLAKVGLWRYAIYLLSDYNNGVRYEDALLLLGPKVMATSASALNATETYLRAAIRRMLPKRAKDYLGRLRTGPKPARRPKLTVQDLRIRISKLRVSLSKIELPSGNGWTKYYEEFPKHGHSCEQTAEWNRKQVNVAQIFDDLSPKSLLDLCSNRGWYSLFAESRGVQVISADIVPEVMNQLYLIAQDGDHDIYPVVMDFCDPFPARGVAYDWFKAATERFRSDMVICLAAIHNLVFGSQLSFDQVVKGLDSFSKRWLLLEFVPKEDETAGKYWTRGKHDWYTEAELSRALEHYFYIRKVLPSFPETRRLFLCERKRAA